MDSGWAVILGAFIALTGSSLIPWLRDSRAEARARKEQADSRRREALVSLIARNSAIGISLGFNERTGLISAFEARDEAASRLLLEVSPGERRVLLPLLQQAVPTRQGEELGSIGRKMKALQSVLIGWASGELGIEKLEQAYSALAHPDSD